MKTSIAPCDPVGAAMRDIRRRTTLNMCLCAILSVLAAVLGFVPAVAQDLQPRAFSPAPVGLNIALLGYALSSGDINFDQALQIENATGDVNGITAAYVRTLGVFGKMAKVSAIVPYAYGTWEGRVEGVPASVTRQGFGDPRVQFAVNFVGAPAVKLKDFRRYSEGTIVGASVAAVVPVGQYYEGRLINIGSNRWEFQPRLGFSSRIRRWTLEAMTDVSLFTDITDAFGGATISQAPIWSLQGNVIYSFRRGWWAGVSGGTADGGATTVNGVDKNNSETNSRLAATLAVPVSRRLSLRFFYINSIKTALGADFNFYNLSLQYTWGGGF
jgi:hypothetical protein